MWNLTPEQLAQWAAAQEATHGHHEATIINAEPTRCGGCGQFLPRDLTEESWVLMGGETYHIREECLTNGVIKMRANHPDWNWPSKDYTDGTQSD